MLLGNLPECLFSAVLAIVTKFGDRAVVSMVHAGKEFLSVWTKAA